MKCPKCLVGHISKVKPSNEIPYYKCSYCPAILTEVEYLKHQILQGEK